MNPTNPSEYMKTFRRRWAILVLATLVGGLLGWATHFIGSHHPGRSYAAKTVLFAPAWLNTAQPNANLNAVAALVTNGPVPIRAAKEVGYRGNPGDLASNIDVKFNGNTGLLYIGAQAPTAKKAELWSSAFTDQLLGFLGEAQANGALSQAKSLHQQLQKLQSRISALEAQIPAAGSSTAQQLLIAKRNAEISQYSLVYQQYVSLAIGSPAVTPSSGSSPSTGSGSPNLQILQEPVASPVDTAITGRFRSPLDRGLIGALVGLIVGIVLALFLDRLDGRIRTREDAERHFSLPVLAEIPAIRGASLGDSEIAAATRPRSQWADAFRLLGAGVLRGPSQNGDSPQYEPGHGVPAPRTILVTSAGLGEGKTTVVANMAATFGELGRKVLILSCDFRRPAVHRFFGVENGRGLSDALSSANGSRILNDNEEVQDTAIDGVRLVPSGPAVEKPAALLASQNMRRALDEASSMADLVLLDAAPLAAAEAMHLLPLADAVVVVARAGRTRADQAEWATEILRRFEAHPVGVALNGGESPPRQR
jgi:capsular exopolysaccharide synthesis family protein